MNRLCARDRRREASISSQHSPLRAAALWMDTAVWCSTTIIAEWKGRKRRLRVCVCGPQTTCCGLPKKPAARRPGRPGVALVRETTAARPLVAPWSQESALQPRSCGQNKCVGGRLLLIWHTPAAVLHWARPAPTDAFLRLQLAAINCLINIFLSKYAIYTICCL